MSNFDPYPARKHRSHLCNPNQLQTRNESRISPSFDGESMSFPLSLTKTVRVKSSCLIPSIRSSTTSSSVLCFDLKGVCKLAGFLKTLEYWQRDKFWDLVSRFLILCLEMLETSALGLGQDLGLLLVLEGAMTNSTYVSRFSFILIPYRFKVRDRCFAMLQGISLSPVFGKHSGLTTDVRSKNCCSCLDLICDRGVRTKGFPFGRQVIGAVVAQLFWLCMKAVLSFIAKDVVAKGLDHDTFLLSIREIKPKKLDTEPVRGQLRGDFLLGRDQAE
ncbi:hypothetical protein F2Q68_00031696 [Brassica cretica]|uniref:Uncharacterized protein n=1 Tax=Brassica cretica TaxID=69181 RepID=A0A8S9GDN0_BRACR|nr:hypothetical protein F2Q68_00031696 [Brassica cretica]